jgi:hypothetical protein
LSELAEVVSALAMREAFISRSVVRCVVLVVSQAARRVMASKPAVILVIILFVLGKT